MNFHPNTNSERYTLSESHVFHLLCCLFSPASSQQQKPSALLDVSLIIRNTITLATAAHQQ